MTRRLALCVLVLAVYVLHQDCWNWKTYQPLVLGFLPIGLAYHAAYSFLAMATMAILVTFAWPHELETLGSEDRPASEECKK